MTLAPHAYRACRLALLALSSVVLASAAAQAVPRYQSVYNLRLGVTDTRLDTCGSCHVDFEGGPGGLNRFGAAFEAVPDHRITPIDALLRVLPEDSDGDGVASTNEVVALFMPGWSCEDVGRARNAPPDLARYVDPTNPGCFTPTELACFDGIDDDGDGLADCEDPDCEGASDGVCMTGQPGVCSVGTRLCSEGAAMCLADKLPETEGPFGGVTCVDGVDNDCDAFVDGDDPGCRPLQEAVCNDAIDDDGDGLLDCEDPDCAGALLGSCDTGEPGQCAAGALTCSDGGVVCSALTPAEIEGLELPATCSDGVDNDCNGLADGEDPLCTGPGFELETIELRAPRRMHLRVGGPPKQRGVRLRIEGTGDASEVTARLRVSPIQALLVAIDPASITRPIEPTGRTRLRFDTAVECREPGRWILDWTADVEVGDALETLGARTTVECLPPEEPDEDDRDDEDDEDDDEDDEDDEDEDDEDD